MDNKQKRNDKNNKHRKIMNFKFNLFSNVVYITPAISVGTEDILHKKLYWLDISFLSFNMNISICV